MSLKFRSKLRRCLILLWCPSMVAQAVIGYHPLDGNQFEELLNKWLPNHDLVAKHARLALTVRVLPPFAAESQLDLVCDFDSKCTIVRNTLSKPLRSTANDALSKGSSIETVGNIRIELITDSIPVESDVAEALVAGFWRSISAFAETSKRPTSNEAEVLLDATTYQVFQTEDERFVEVVVPGPELGQSPSRPQKLNAIVEWSQSFFRQFEERLKATKGPKKP